jgi:hypothetical protein
MASDFGVQLLMPKAVVILPLGFRAKLNVCSAKLERLFRVDLSRSIECGLRVAGVFA